MNKPSFKCLSKLGSGAYATVWLALDQTTLDKVAVKVVSDSRFFESAVHEHNMCKNLSHPNLIQTRSCFKTQSQTVMLVQEFAEKGDLFNFIAPEVGMSRDRLCTVFPQMVDGVAYLHSQNLVHRDIKPENVVISGDDVAKLCDFGMMDFDGKRAAHGSGTGPYMSPEILGSKNGVVANKAHDIWALGVSLYVLLTGDFPWLKATQTDADYAAFSSGRLLGSWAKFSPELVSLMRRMLAPIETRCTIEEVQASLAAALGINCNTAELVSSISLTTSICDDVVVKIAARERYVIALADSGVDSQSDVDEVHVVAVAVPLPAVATIRRSVVVKC